MAHGIVVYTALWLLVRIDSMTSLSSFLLGASLLAAMRLRFVAKAAWIRHGLLTIAWAVVLSVLFFGIGGSILTLMGRDPTLTGRTELWAALSALNPNPWLGAGFEAFWRGPKLDKLARAGIYANEAHNGYFEVYLNLGWMGVTLLVLLISAGYRNISRTIRLDPRTGTLWLAYFVTGLVYSLTEAGFRVNSPMWITFLMAIMGSSVTSTIARDTKNAGLSEPGKCETTEDDSSEVIPVRKWSGVAARETARTSWTGAPRGRPIASRRAASRRASANSRFR
jgi:O-antigen ligase